MDGDSATGMLGAPNPSTTTMRTDEPTSTTIGTAEVLPSGPWPPNSAVTRPVACRQVASACALGGSEKAVLMDGDAADEEEPDVGDVAEGAEQAPSATTAEMATRIHSLPISL
jgi:hypothetical protein